jgi:hypothetical protein
MFKKPALFQAQEPSRMEIGEAGHSRTALAARSWHIMDISEENSDMNYNGKRMLGKNSRDVTMLRGGEIRPKHRGIIEVRANDDENQNQIESNLTNSAGSRRLM